MLRAFTDDHWMLRAFSDDHRMLRAFSDDHWMLRAFSTIIECYERFQTILKCSREDNGSVAHTYEQKSSFIPPYIATSEKKDGKHWPGWENFF